MISQTWLAFAAAALAAWAAFRAFRGQQDEATRHVLALERQQADQVEVSHGPGDVVPRDAPSAGAGHHKCHMVEVVNNSHRPIRDVAARLTPVQVSGEWFSARQVFRLAYSGAGGASSGWQVFDKADSGEVWLTRRELRYGLAFPMTARDHPEVQMLVRLTDDAGLHWQIDEDLHLSKLSHRDDW